MITLIIHIPSGSTWTTGEYLFDRINVITNFNYIDGLTFEDERGREVLLTPNIVRECVFEKYGEDGDA